LAWACSQTQVAVAAILFSLLLAANSQTSPDDPLLPARVVERGSCWRVWQRSVLVTNLITGEISSEARSWIELQGGMHYWSQDRWVESEDVIEIRNGAALAIRGSHKVVFNANANTAGAIDFLSSAGQRLQSQVLGLYYFCPRTGQRVQIARIKDSLGTLYPPNQVVYADCFVGARCYLIYTYTKGGFQHDLALLKFPPYPEVFGLSETSIRLELWT
jgi:protein tyrosine phosphatase (PTP) superfamily phosphohydrolase (DUF442 family)